MGITNDGGYSPAIRAMRVGSDATQGTRRRGHLCDWRQVSSLASIRGRQRATLVIAATTSCPPSLLAGNVSR